METISIFIQGTTAVCVLVLAILTFMGRSTNALREDIKELRVEMNVKFSEVRTEMHDINTRLDRVNTRLGRVEGHLRISDDHQVGR
ncbi:MAG: hypothetical protein OXN93_06295 [bacterium]|nr:hypothetical protein [bacterium]